MSQASLRPLGPGEYLVHVDYSMPRDKAVLEAEFSQHGVSELFYGDNKWERILACDGIDQTPGERIFLVKYPRKVFRLRDDQDMFVYRMGRRGYRPAIHLEAYAFAKAYPHLQLQFSMVALGSMTLLHGIWNAAIFNSYKGKRFLGNFFHDGRWRSTQRFLFVRKQSSHPVSVLRSADAEPGFYFRIFHIPSSIFIMCSYGCHWERIVILSGQFICQISNEHSCSSNQTACNAD